MIIEQLQRQLPEHIKKMQRLINLSRNLNRLTGSTYYTPEIVQQLPYDDLEDMMVVAQWQT